MEALREADQWRMDNEAAWQARAALLFHASLETSAFHFGKRLLSDVLPQ